MRLPCLAEAPLALAVELVADPPRMPWPARHALLDLPLVRLDPEQIRRVVINVVDNAVEAMTSMLEPIMIVVLALIVGTIVIALFLPLITIIQNLSGGTGA